MTDELVIVGRCEEVMRQMPAASVDAIVCDPPYGLEFMNEDWDAPWKHEITEHSAKEGLVAPRFGSTRNPVCRTCRKMKRGSDRCRCETPEFDESPADDARAFQAWCEVWAAEAMRVLKPGGFLLAFGGTRTYHRLTCAVEDAGFEVKDSLLWLYGKGFPKSLNVARAIDKKLGVDVTDDSRWRQEEHPNRGGGRAGNRGMTIINQTEHATDQNPEGLRHVYEPVTDEARAWDGWGTALKPAFEPIVCARKPIPGTVAENFLTHGVGGFNIDGCRIGEDAGWSYPNGRGGTAWGRRDSLAGNLQEPMRAQKGRWPANVILQHGPDCVEGECAPGCVVLELDEMSGELPRGHWPGSRPTNSFGFGHAGQSDLEERTAERGGASRFFYSAKVSRAERDAGLDESFEKGDLNWSSGDENPGAFQSEGTERSVRNHHPTVKPIAVMRWLVRLVTPPGGVVLDPFTGSGSTLCAAALEGVRAIGIEQSGDYARIAVARERFWREHGEEGLEVVKRAAAAERRREVVAESGQMDLFAGA